MSKFKKSTLLLEGLLQALGIAVYCSLVGLLMWKGESLFGNVANFAGPAAFLILFIVSALVCTSIVFYKPYTLFVDNKKKEALDLVLITTGWLAITIVLFLVVAAFLR